MAIYNLRDFIPMRSVCDSCQKKKAKWKRATQFSGEYFFCKKCAKEQKDFKENDSYKYWIKINRDK